MERANDRASCARARELGALAFLGADLAVEKRDKITKEMGSHD
jgi:hypothetical protein